MQTKAIKIKVWKEGRKVLIRSDEYHINTYGNNFDSALKNFYEAYELNVSGGESQKNVNNRNLTLVVNFPTAFLESNRFPLQKIRV